jgi:cyclopropane fatty-acyl-phospholipid synthase-like methyltransferase
MDEWVAFWDSDHSIYVNARHRDVHYRAIAQDIVRRVPSPTSTVLDYGCGEALHADRVTAAAGRLILVEAATTVRAALSARFKDSRAIDVRSPEEIRALPDHSIDLIVMISVSQYVSKPELDDLLATFRRLLKADGALLIGDVVSPDVSVMTDVLALLRFARRNGFLGAALRGLVRTLLSDYRRLRTTLGLTLYREAEMLEKVRAAGFAVRRAEANVGHNQARMTFLARPG